MKRRLILIISVFSLLLFAGTRDDITGTGVVVGVCAHDASNVYAWRTIY